MEWIKIIDKSKQLPSGSFIATDGKRFLLSTCRRFNGCCEMHLSESTHYILLSDIKFHDQPERSKREDSHKCEMRCSEHCGNTVRDK